MIGYICLCVQSGKILTCMKCWIAGVIVHCLIDAWNIQTFQKYSGPRIASVLARIFDGIFEAISLQLARNAGRAANSLNLSSPTKVSASKLSAGLIFLYMLLSGKFYAVAYSLLQSARTFRSAKVAFAEIEAKLTPFMLCHAYNY